jgi:CheY-like chemotaxis protein
MSSILLVDDSDLFRGAAEAVLKRTGCQTLMASGGTEALDVVRRERPQMIVVSAGMRGMTGIDLCRVLKADPAFARTPIVLVGPPEAIDQAARVGADATLALPLDTEAFFSTARRFLQLMPREEARSAVEWSVTFWLTASSTRNDPGPLRGGFFPHVRAPAYRRALRFLRRPGGRGPDVWQAMVVRLGREPDPGLGCRFFQLSAASRSHLEECLRILAPGEAPV